MLQTQYVRDARGVCVGMLEYHDDGDVVARDSMGRYLGAYNPREDITRDAMGRYICKGNMVASLIHLV